MSRSGANNVSCLACIDNAATEFLPVAEIPGVVQASEV
jgi:hypothetical protein